MKEFILTQPYNTVEEMLNSGEVAVYKEELEQGDIDKYAIVSRIGNRYDLNGKKIDGCVKNPFYATKEKVEEKNENLEVKNMKYAEVEAFIDKEIEKAIAEVKVQHEKEIANLKVQHEVELSNLKSKHVKELADITVHVKDELIAKLTNS